MTESAASPLLELANDELIALAKQSITQRFYDHAEHYVNYLQNKPNQTNTILTEVEQLTIQLTNERLQNPFYHIVIIGDSLSLPHPQYLKTYDPITNPFLSTSLEQTYPARLEQALSTVKPHKKIRATNLSQRGYTVRDLVDQRHDVFCWHNPDLIVFHVGLVDAFPRGEDLTEQKTTLDDFKRFFRLLLDFRAQSCPSKPIIMIDITPSNQKIADKYPVYQQHIKEYNQVLQSLTTDYDHCYCLPTASLFDAEDPYQLLHLDGQHLSSAGHQQVANALTKIIKDNRL